MAAPLRHTASPKSSPTPAVYTANEVAILLAIPKPSLYELARREPERLGAIRLGRTVRFRRDVIERLLRGEA